MNVICGVVKDFLTHLREPVLTFRLHNTFMAAIGNIILGNYSFYTYVVLLNYYTSEGLFLHASCST